MKYIILMILNYLQNIEGRSFLLNKAYYERIVLSNKSKISIYNDRNYILLWIWYICKYY